MSTQELPLCCRQCAHKQSQYLYPSWSHRCVKMKPMVENCRWKTGHREPRIVFAWQRTWLRAWGLR